MEKVERMGELYSYIEGWMLEYGLKPTELIIFGLINGMSQDGKSACNSSLSQMERLTGASRHSVINAIKTLEKKDLIKTIKTKNTHSNNIYYSTISRTPKEKRCYPAPSNPFITSQTYTIVAKWMSERLSLSSKELLLFAIIYGFSSDGNSRCKASMSYLRYWISAAVNETVITGIESLREKGLVEVLKSSGKNNEYYALVGKDGLLEQTSRKNALAVCNDKKITSTNSALATSTKVALGSGKNALATGTKVALSININNNKNNTATNSAIKCEKHDENKEKTVAAELSQILTKIFGYKTNFSSDFFQEIQVNIPKKMQEEYLEYAYKILKPKCKKNLEGYFFSEAKRISNISKFLIKKQNEIKKEKDTIVECPCCGKKFEKALHVCPLCGIETKDFENAILVKHRQTYIALPVEKKNAYDAEIFNFKRGLSLFEKMRLSQTDEYQTEFAAYKAAVDRKYGLL